MFDTGTGREEDDRAQFSAPLAPKAVSLRGSRATHQLQAGRRTTATLRGLLEHMAGIRAIVELGASFGVGLAAAGGAGYYMQQELRRRRDESIAALRPAAPAKAPAFDYDALYAAPPRREGPVYAFLRDGWNGALDGARKAIGDIFAP